jgi:hypothetical protein
MSKPYDRAPSDVVAALEALELANEPYELGPSYQAVLSWRRKQPTRIGRTVIQCLIFVLSMLAIIALPRVFTFDIPQFWLGAAFGANVVLLANAIQRWSARRQNITMTFVERVDQAIDRWRHAVPAMRERPQ